MAFLKGLQEVADLPDRSENILVGVRVDQTQVSLAEFSKLVRSVEEALSSFDAQPQEILHLMGFHTESQPNASAA